MNGFSTRRTHMGQRLASNKGGMLNEVIELPSLAALSAF